MPRTGRDRSTGRKGRCAATAPSVRRRRPAASRPHPCAATCDTPTSTTITAPTCTATRTDVSMEDPTTMTDLSRQAQAAKRTTYRHRHLCLARHRRGNLQPVRHTGRPVQHPLRRRTPSPNRQRYPLPPSSSPLLQASRSCRLNKCWAPVSVHARRACYCRRSARPPLVAVCSPATRSTLVMSRAVENMARELEGVRRRANDGTVAPLAGRYVDV